MVRPGHSLVEALVALVLLAVGALAAAAVTASAGANLRAAAAEEQAVVHAAALLDSIVQAPRWLAGSSVSGPLQLAWTAGGASESPLIELVISFTGQGHTDRFGFAVLAAAPPPPLPSAAPGTPQP